MKNKIRLACRAWATSRTGRWRTRSSPHKEINKMNSNKNQGGSNANQTGASGGAKQKGRARWHSPATVELRSVEPWPEPVDGAWLLDALMKELERFMIFPKWAAATLALWILHTYAFRLRDVTTYIGIESPVRECGKSTLVTVLSKFVDRAAISSNISSSAFFHVIEELQPTLFIDESDRNLRGKHDLLGILNAGYTKATAFVWRMAYGQAPEEEDGEEAEAGSGKSGRAVRFSCWCPKAIASIGHLPATLASRCIVFQMQRKLDQELCERLKALDGTDLQRMCVRFVLDREMEIAKAAPIIPVGLSNRAADIWEPLLVLSDLAGGALARDRAAGGDRVDCACPGREPGGSTIAGHLHGFCGSKSHANVQPGSGAGVDGLRRPAMGRADPRQTDERAMAGEATGSLWCQTQEHAGWGGSGEGLRARGIDGDIQALHSKVSVGTSQSRSCGAARAAGRNQGGRGEAAAGRDGRVDGSRGRDIGDGGKR
jgi:Protein of unknown function (DUF3631)